ncbi:MAG: ribonuclease H-like domain-containing protein [Bacteroidota bacterium]
MTTSFQLELFSTPSEVYYDIETQLSANEVGGWNNIHRMRVSVAVTWCQEDGFKRWDEASVPALIHYLAKFRRIISFNGDGFDTRVLSYYGNVYPVAQRSFDLLVDLKQRIGRRLGLDSLARATLGKGKSADGLTALRWWKEGKIELIAEYCQQDVQVMVDLVVFAREHGFVKFDDGQAGIKTIAVSW